MTPYSEQLLKKILKLHFDPANGSRYWLEREKSLGFSVREEIENSRDLWKLGPMPIEDLAERSVEDFIPLKFLKSGRPMVLGETGGVTGRPKTTAYFEDEFIEIFVRPFLAVACALEFSAGGRWLWIGPGGPHIIGKAANAIARFTSGCDAFAIDFDPRWYRKLAPESIARERYMGHLVQQSLNIISQQHIGCLFSTPVVLAALADRLASGARQTIKGIYLGGMTVEKPVLEKLRSAFPNACLIAGYGNTLFGVCHAPEDLRKENSDIRYFPQNHRLYLTLVSADAEVPDAERIRLEVGEGEEGQVMFHRLDESFFLPNVLERDGGTKAGHGICSPAPLKRQLFKVDAGIY